MSNYADYYVSPNGSDDSPGTWAAPFASLDRARRAVRELRARRPDVAVTVLLRGGTYHVPETVVFGRDDGGPQRVTYAGYPGETAVLSAGLPVEGWQRIREPGATGALRGTDGGGADADESGSDRILALLSAEARKHVWTAESPTGARVTGLYCGTERLQRARSDAFSPLTDERREPTDEFYYNHMIVPRSVVPDGVGRAERALGGGDLVVIPQHNWTMNILPIAGFDAATSVIETRYPCTYPLLPNRRTESVWFENLPWTLTEPGEWLCTDDGRIYYWPEGNEEPTDIVATNLSELIRVEGEIDYDGPTDLPVTGVQFRDLEFRHGSRFQWYGQTGWGIQHDWEAFDRPTALVRFRGAEDCGVADCKFHASDGAGVRLDLHAKRIEITGNHLWDLGGCAVVMVGYGPGTKDVNRGNVVYNNHIHHIGRVTWHSPGVFIWQSGENRVAHNLIHNTGYTGIVASGRIKWDREGRQECSRTIRWDEVEPYVGASYEQPLWHQAWKADWDRREPLLHSRKNIIEYNEIHHVMEVMGDGNGVYISGAGAGNVVAHNRVHSCPSPHMAEGLRCDDDQHETLLADNLIYGLGGFATGITIKGITTIVRNIIATPHVQKTRRGMISLEVGPLTDTIIRDNVILCTSRDHALYYQGPRIHGAGPEPLLRDCKADHNLYWNTAEPSLPQKHLEDERIHGIELESRAMDPGFVDAANGDYRLSRDSPVRELGIDEDPAALAGLTDDYRDQGARSE